MNTTRFRKFSRLRCAPLSLLSENLGFSGRAAVSHFDLSPVALIAVLWQQLHTSQITSTPSLPSTTKPCNNVKSMKPAGSLSYSEITAIHSLLSFPKPNLFSTLSNNPKSTNCVYDGDDDAKRDDDDDEERDDADDDETDDDDDDGDGGQSLQESPIMFHNVESIVALLSDSGKNNIGETPKLLENCGICVTSELVSRVLSRVRNDHAAAYTFFLWAAKQRDYKHSVRHYHAMVSILAKNRKFDTAWALVDEMRMLSIVTSKTLVIMMRRYSAKHDVGNAINTFYAFKRFGFEVGIEEFHELLSALCRYKNVEDAEHLLHCNEDVFPLETKSFNIVLNGWCKAKEDLRQAMRLWKEMAKKGIPRDAYSYSSIISCYARVGNINGVMRMFNLMKDEGVSRDRKIYNSVIYALARRGNNYLHDAMNIVRMMEQKKGEGEGPNVATYNSLIKALCKAKRVNDARSVLNRMCLNNISPSVMTYHPLLRRAVNAEEVFDLLNEMRRVACAPVVESYLMLIRKFCRWRQLNIVWKLWDEMHKYGLSHDRSSYSVLINGLFLNGFLEDAWRFYQEMKAKGFEPEPKMDEMLKAWVARKAMTSTCTTLEGRAETTMTTTNGNKSGNCSTISKSVGHSLHSHDFVKKHEIRSITREKGFNLQ